MPRANRHSRRLMLKGAGVAMALPWLESLPVWGEETSSSGAPPVYPKRFGVLFMACGIHGEHW
ncbi:MAG: hypothetical protein KDA75_19920, partial [Planctomycetaceae bacterium]|nr:hypothetical protein [Planctomycetaceae bacterium]